MKIIAIEPTPSPNTMKLTINVTLSKMQRFTYSTQTKHLAPGPIFRLLEIPGVQSIFHCADFLAIERNAKADWQSILSQIREILGDAQVSDQAMFDAKPSVEQIHQAQVWLQVFRSIPMQIRVKTSYEEVRVAMPDRFIQAALQAGMSSSQFIQERKLIDLGIRDGNPQELAHEIILEQEASWSDVELANHVQQLAVHKATDTSDSSSAEWLSDASPLDLNNPAQITSRLQHPDWQIRFSTLKQLQPSQDTFPWLMQAIQDTHVLIRRLATVYLGDIRQPDIVPILCKMLNDPSPSVRRTAGDTLSDIGDPQAIPAMIKALQDTNKLVRWRAARFLFEVADESCLQALTDALNEPEFEVRMQVQMAIERITSGHEAQGPVWQQMTKKNP